jgi:hypothetical protein
LINVTYAVKHHPLGNGCMVATAKLYKI